MANQETSVGPEHTAVRVALWRALHVQIDPEPHVLKDEVGEMIVGEPAWRVRPDMNPDFSKPMRASIVGRARLIEDLVENEVKKGVAQYVILGAGIDTFAQRRPELASQMQIFEIDQPGPQSWKRQRLKELGLAVPASLHFVPVNFESQSWWEKLLAAGFDIERPAVIASTGVSLYLTKEANRASLQQLSQLAPGSTLAVTFMLSLDLLESKERSTMEFVMNKAREAGTPFLSLFLPNEITDMAKVAGFKDANYVSAEEIYRRYFANRSDGLRAGSAEAFLIAST